MNPATQNLIDTVLNSGPFNSVRAPGRVNLIGEHTDYNAGFVLPVAIDLRTTIHFKPRSDKNIRLHSAAAGETVEFNFENEIPKSPPAWSLYVKGVAEILRRKNLLAAGIDAVINSKIPLGGGLSSSAALEISTALALLSAGKTKEKLSPVDLALAAQWAEHNYANMPSGLMDQFISAMGEKNHAMLLDCRDNTHRQIPFPDSLRIVVVNSNVKHQLVAGEYAARRSQCEAAAKILGIPLRDATLESLIAAKSKLDATLHRRAHHVISENLRTLAFAQALTQNDFSLCGRLLYESHASLRDDFEVSCRELDTLVEIASAIPGVHGARMTGGGFGGCILALTTPAAVQPLADAINLEYPKRTHRQPTIFTTTASAGALTDKYNWGNK